MQESKSSKLFLISSLVLGLVAAVVSFAYLNNATSADNIPTVKIIVAKHDLREGTMLDPERDFGDLDIPKIPKLMTALRDRCLTPELSTAYKGQRVNRRILSGTPIMLADLLAVADLEIAAGKVAVSIPATAKTSKGLYGLLIPGDQVRLLVTTAVIKPGAGAGGGTGTIDHWDTTEVLKDPVKVLAVGSRITKSRTQISVADQYQAPAESDTAQAVTVEVTEDQAKTILSATGAGTMPVTLVLCPPEKVN